MEAERQIKREREPRMEKGDTKRGERKRERKITVC